ncbi:MAG: hypothetical protein IT555_04590 [Acetobacteraceae bacterium]|nr:hypothetical protein [Acetobacteraceae bacterium]
MTLFRRALVCAAPLLLARAARAAPAALRLEAVGEGVAALTGTGVRRPLLLPAGGARLLPALACGGEMLSVAGFALAEGGAVLEWAAVALALDDAVVLLALEPLRWRGAEGGRMGTRISASGDRMRLVLQRDSAMPAGPTLWRREAWTDYLAWAPPCGLADAPVRAAPADTRQHEVADWRRRAARLVAEGPAALTAAGFAAAGLQTARFTLAAGGPPTPRRPWDGRGRV